jgi:hypothetical protein
MNFNSPEFWVALLQIIGINIVLSPRAFAAPSPDGDVAAASILFPSDPSNLARR